MNSSRRAWVRLILGALLTSIFQVAALSCSRLDSHETVELIENSIVERSLRHGESHSFLVEINKGDYFRALVDQNGIDVRVLLLLPDGKIAVDSDNQKFERGQEVVVWVGDRNGQHVLKIESELGANQQTRKKAPGGYRIEIASLHGASQEEALRTKAEQFYQEGDRLWVISGEPALRESIAAYSEALALYRQLEDRSSEALVLNSLGLVYFPLGEIAIAIDYYERALVIYRSIGDRNGEADNLFNVGQALLATGEATRAIEILLEAADTYRYVKNDSGLARCLNDIGLAHWQLGNSAASIQSYETALAMSLRIGDRRREAEARNALALVQIRRGELQSARLNLEQAVDYYEEIENSKYLATVLTNMGRLLRFLGDHDGALDYYRRALGIARSIEDRKSESIALNNMGYLMEKEDDFSRAVEFYREALPIFEALKDRSGEAMALENMARAYSGLGEDDRSTYLLEKALDIRLDIRDLPGQGFALQSLGIVSNRSGKIKEARRFFAQSLEIAIRIGDRRSEAVSLQGLAQAELMDGNSEKALEHVREALKVTESARSTVADQDFRSTFLSSTRDFYELEVEILMALESRYPNEGYTDKALQASETARARSLLELLSEAHVDVRQGITPGLKELERDNRERLSRIQAQLISLRAQSKPHHTKIESLEDELELEEERRLQLEEKIRTQHPRYASLQYPSPLGAADIQPHLDGDTALLEYALGEQSSYLFVLTREGLTSYTLPGETVLAPDVEDLRQILVHPGRREFGRYKQLAFSLYQTLLAPAETDLADKSRLIIVPDGILTYLTFESLLTNVSGERSFGDLPYLLDRWAVSYVPSATVLVSLATKPAPPPGSTRFFGVGDPLYDLPAAAPAQTPPTTEPGWEPLRGLFGSDGTARLVRLEDSARETRAAAEIFGPANSKLLIGKDASEENLKRSPELRQARYLHFATHGLISERNPQYSGLVLNLDDDPTEDGLFQVYEIFDLEIEADLVVLSACRSGLGKNVRGEGLVGLTRAFFYAGAPSVVVSLWPVADRSTADLMASFYRHLQTGAGKTEALRQAKLELRRGGRFQHPYYWAPFVLTGRP